jgi:hypothetical protein
MGLKKMTHTSPTRAPTHALFYISLPSCFKNEVVEGATETFRGGPRSWGRGGGVERGGGCCYRSWTRAHHQSGLTQRRCSLSYPVFIPKPCTYRMHDPVSIVPHIRSKVFTDNQISRIEYNYYISNASKDYDDSKWNGSAEDSITLQERQSGQHVA